jgi:hypothetical protein
MFDILLGLGLTFLLLRLVERLPQRQRVPLVSARRQRNASRIGD